MVPLYGVGLHLHYITCLFVYLFRMSHNMQRRFSQPALSTRRQSEHDVMDGVIKSILKKVDRHDKNDDDCHIEIPVRLADVTPPSTETATWDGEPGERRPSFSVSAASVDSYIDSCVRVYSNDSLSFHLDPPPTGSSEFEKVRDELRRQAMTNNFTPLKDSNAETKKGDAKKKIARRASVITKPTYERRGSMSSGVRS